MCGIAGVIGGSESRETVERMIGRLTHRGPDDSGVTVRYLSGDQVWCLLVLDRWMDYAGQY